MLPFDSGGLEPRQRLSRDRNFIMAYYGIIWCRTGRYRKNINYFKMHELSLNKETIHVWTCPLDKFYKRSLLNTYYKLLSEAEKNRLNRFVFPERKNRFLISHAVVRLLLSLYSEIKPTEWKFDLGKYGKPYISSTLNSEKLHFNISSVSGLLVIAVTYDNDVGIDIEKYDEKIDQNQVARICFSKEEIVNLKKITDSEIRLRHFFANWTMKEAFSKMLGNGLFMPLTECGFSFDGERGIQFKMTNIENHDNRLFFNLIHLDKQFIISLCVSQSVEKDKKTLMAPKLEFGEISPRCFNFGKKQPVAAFGYYDPGNNARIFV